MTKFYVMPSYLISNNTELIEALISNDVYIGNTIQELADEVDAADGNIEGNVFLLEIIDRGKMETSHRFVSDNKISKKSSK